jgi:hypothetical protein
MTRLAFAALIAAASMCRPAQAQPLYTCGPGTVLSVKIVTELVKARTAKTQWTADREPPLSPQIASDEKQNAYVVTVRLNDTIYTAKASADTSGNFDPTHLAMSETIGVCANGTRIVLDRFDGTDFRATIVRFHDRRQIVATSPDSTLALADE